VNIRLYIFSDSIPIPSFHGADEFCSGVSSTLSTGAAGANEGGGTTFND